METPVIRNAKAFPGAPARVRMSAAIGVEPSEQTSRTVATIRVRPSPRIEGPNKVSN